VEETGVPEKTTNLLQVTDIQHNNKIGNIIYFTYRLTLYFSLKLAVFTSVKEKNNKINTNICVFLIFKIEKNHLGIKMKNIPIKSTL
jgi:hypothetical protein